MRALALLALAACGAGFDLEGEHRRYVISKLELPETAADATRYGRDLDGNGRADNLFGGVFSTLATYGISVEDGNDRALVTGEILMLIDLQARDLTTAAAAGIQVFQGSNPTPTPCSSSTMCGQHLQGTGHFDLYTFSPPDAIPGTIRSGVFTSVAGELALQVSSHGDKYPRAMPLIGARIEVTKLGDDAIEGVIAGAVERAKAIELGKQLLGDIKFAQYDCDVSAAPPDCGCTSALSLVLIHEFDTDHNCLLFSSELEALDPAIAPLDATDVSIGGVAGASIGFGFRAVRATFSTDL